MNGSWLFVLGGICGAAVAMLPKAAAHLHSATHAIRGDPASPGVRAHTEEKFSFTAHAAMDRVLPLFGADKERAWAPGWNPRFLYPQPASDERGMVFNAAHDRLSSIWVNTDFDTKNGRVQYVYAIPDALITVITLRLKSEENQTKVEVQYDRTALRAEADDHVREMARQDSTAGPDWEKQINQYLEKRKGS
jgi:hypothetical protein